MPTVKDSPARGWTPKFIESLKPRPTRYEIAEDGLVLRVHPSGVKSFRWYVRSLDRVIVIGPFAFSKTPAHVTLKEAQDWLHDLREARRAGEAQLNAMVAKLRGHLEPKATSDAGDTVATIAEDFYKRRILPHRKRPEAARRILDLDIIPHLGAQSINALTTRECARVIEKVVDRDAAVHAGKVLAVLKQLCRFAQSRGYTDRNPAAPLEPKDLGVITNVTSRWLTADEIPIFWKALEADRERTPVQRHDVRTGSVQKYAQGYAVITAATRAALRILLLTGVRSSEILLAGWQEIDFDAATWTIPVGHTKYTLDQAKKARPFTVPLAPMALALFRELQRLAGKSPWVMASDAEEGHYTPKSLGRAMRRMQMGKVSMLKLPGGMASPHDLRRTMRTHLGKLRVPLHVVERALNHSLGRIVQTYDVGDYLDERREALERWDAFVAGLLNPEAAKVIPMSAKGA